MELIKPQKKCINIFNRQGEPDCTIGFYYSSDQDQKKIKRTYRISLRNFFYRNKLKWQYINFAIEHGSIIFFEGDQHNGYKFNDSGYICNVSLIETICDVYKIKIKNKAFTVFFKCDKINDRTWRILLDK